MTDQNNAIREALNSEPSAQLSAKMTGSRALSSELVELRWRNSTNSVTDLNNATHEALNSEPSAQLSVKMTGSRALSYEFVG